MKKNKKKSFKRELPPPPYVPGKRFPPRPPKKTIILDHSIRKNFKSRKS